MQTPLLSFPTSGGTLSLVGSTTGREVDEWFDSFSLLTDGNKAAVNIQAGKPLSVDMPTKTLGVRVDGEPLPHAGLQASHRAMGVAVMARSLPDASPEGEAVEEVTIWSPEFELTVTSDKHPTGRHLNMKMNALPPGASGLLAELAGVQPMSMRAKISQISPDKQGQQAARKMNRVGATAEQANEAMREAEVKVEEAQAAIRKAHAKGAEAKEASASFDESVLAKRAAEGRAATKTHHRKHGRNGGGANGKKRSGPEGHLENEYPGEPYEANMSATVDLKQMQAKTAAKKAQRKLKRKMQEEAKAAFEEAKAEKTRHQTGAEVEAKAGTKSEKKAHLMKELPSPSPVPAVITTDPVGDAAAAAAVGGASLPGCHSIALISDSWCVNNCLMANCPKDMCSDECFAEPVQAEVAEVNAVRSNETAPEDEGGCRSVNEAIASDSWCLSSCSLGNCPEAICSSGCKDQPTHRGPPVTQQQQAVEDEKSTKGKKSSLVPSPSPAPRTSSKHSALWMAKHEAGETGSKSKHSALWLAKHAPKTAEKAESKPLRTVGEQLKETLQLEANLTMTEARELAQKVEMLKLDLRKVGPRGIVKKQAKSVDEEDDELEMEAESGGAVMVDESKKLASKKQSVYKTGKASTTKSTKPSKPTSKLRKAAVVPSPQPSPEPVAAADPVAADPVAADLDTVDPEGEGCHSLSASLASDDWCMSNCALGNCPLTMCSTDCSSLKSGNVLAKASKELVSDSESSEDGLAPCHSIGDGPVDDGWCVSNCALGNCPEKACSGGCLRPGKAGASKLPGPTGHEEKAVTEASNATSSGKAGAAKAGNAEILSDAEEQDAQGRDEQEDVTVSVGPAAASKATKGAVVKKSSKKGNSKVEVWGADVVHPKKATVGVDAFLGEENKS